jgi:Integrase zinc binding domain
VLLDGRRHLAQLDSGSSRSLIDAKLAADLGKAIKPQQGRITFADPFYSVPRIGLASSIHVQVGSSEILYDCEIIPQLAGAPFLIGRDLMEQLALDHGGLPFRYHDQASNIDNSPPRLFPPSDPGGGSGSGKPTANHNTHTRTLQSDKPSVMRVATLDPHRSYSASPSDQHDNIILRHHLCGHFGAKAIIDSIHEAGYDWPSLGPQVREFCSKCIPCQRHNIAKHGYHPLSPISANQLFDHRRNQPLTARQ